MQLLVVCISSQFQALAGAWLWQREDQFSDGTRLLGLLWALQEGDGLLLLEVFPQRRDHGAFPDH
jgi:hypothetical protein